MYPSAQVSLRGGVWLTSKLRKGTWYLREGLWMSKRTWHHILSFCQSRVSGKRQRTQEGNSWRDWSRTLIFFSHCKIKKKKEAESQNTLIRFCLYYCVFSLPLESTKHFIWNLWPWFLKAGAKSKYLIFDKLLKVKWNCSYSAYKSYSDGHYGNPYSKQAVLAVAKCGKFFDTYADKNPTEINSFSGYDTIKITEFYFFPHQQHLCWFM